MFRPASTEIDPEALEVRDTADAGAGRPRVLVADDSRAQRILIASSLRRSGFDVVEAEDGDAALAAIREHRLTLVLSDWMMPGLTGPELCRAVRADTSHDYVYFILLTSKSERAEIASGLEQGADDFLTKPVNGEELRARLSSGLRVLRMQRELRRKNALLSDTLGEVQRLYDLIDSDLREANKLQVALLRERFRDYGTAHVSLMLRSSGHVGGDLVGHFRASPTQLGLYSIDVSGHGIASALLTARLAGHLTTTAPEHNIALTRSAGNFFRVLPTDVVVRRFNDLMHGVIETEHYFTIVFAVVDLTTGEVELTQAGHPPPLIQRASGAIEFLGDGGLPVGLLPQADYDRVTARLSPGDRLLLASDGISECPRRDDGALLEDAGLAALMDAARGKRGPALLEALTWDLAAHHGDDNFPDDVSAVLYEFNRRGRPDG